MITLTLHSEYIRDDEDCGSVIVSTRDWHVTLEESIFVMIIDRKYWNAAIRELR